MEGEFELEDQLADMEDLAEAAEDGASSSGDEGSEGAEEDAAGADRQRPARRRPEPQQGAQPCAAVQRASAQQASAAVPAGLPAVRVQPEHPALCPAQTPIAGCCASCLAAPLWLPAALSASPARVRTPAVVQVSAHRSGSSPGQGTSMKKSASWNLHSVWRTCSGSGAVRVFWGSAGQRQGHPVPSFAVQPYGMHAALRVHQAGAKSFCPQSCHVNAVVP